VNVIEVEQLSVKYQHVDVLSDVTFAVEAGEYLGIVGPNGSGKTTLVKALLGLVPAAEGQARICGQRSDRFREWHRIGYLPQITAGLQKTFPATVWEIVGSGLLPRKRFPKRITKADGSEIEAVLALLDIEDLKGKMIGRLSSGQQQRVLLARALVSDPDILILDEPTVALDPETRDRFYRTLKDMNRERGKTVVIITHDSASVGEYASHLLYLDRRVVFFGTFEEFCASEDMAKYFGEYAQHVICHRH